LNNGKVGRAFKLTKKHVEFLIVVQYLFSMPYRRVDGFARALNRLILKLPSVDCSWVRGAFYIVKIRFVMVVFPVLRLLYQYVNVCRNSFTFLFRFFWLGSCCRIPLFSPSML
jgi:hypothetical protein